MAPSRSATARSLSDGGYLLPGDTTPVQYGGLVPWLAKVDGSGALVWQQADYQVCTRPPGRL